MISQIAGAAVVTCRLIKRVGTWGWNVISAEKASNRMVRGSLKRVENIVNLGFKRIYRPPRLKKRKFPEHEIIESVWKTPRFHHTFSILRACPTTLSDNLFPKPIPAISNQLTGFVFTRAQLLTIFQDKSRAHRTIIRSKRSPILSVP